MHEILLKAYLMGWRHRDTISGDEWAERNITSVPYSPQPGHLTFAHRPYLREPLQAATTMLGVSVVVMMAPVQAGKTMVFDCSAAWHAVNNPGPILVLSDTDANANDYAEGRLNILFEVNQPMAGMLPPDRRKNKRNSKRLTNGTVIWILGAHTPKNLQRRSIKILIGDEIWKWPQGHIGEAIARTTAFHGASRCIFGSQAGDERQEMADLWEQTDRKEWCWTCPECGAEQAWGWEMAKWDDVRTEKREPDWATIRASCRYACTKCGREYPNSRQTLARLNKASRYVVQNPHHSAGKLGYHFTALAFHPLEELVEEYVRSQMALKDGNEEPYKIFVQKRLAATWREELGTVEAEVPLTGVLMNRPWDRMAWITNKGLVPVRPEGTPAAPCAALTVDVMKDYFYYVIRAWALDGSSMLIDCGRLTSWAQVKQKQEEYGIMSSCVYVDYGYETDTVVLQCHNNGWQPCKGSGLRAWRHKRRKGHVTLPYSPYETTKAVGGTTCRLISFASNAMKDIIHFSRIRTLNGREPGWNVPDDIPKEYLNHLAAEKRMQKISGSWVWEQQGSRPNHLLDCECMQILFALLLNLPVAADYRMDA